MVETVQPAFVSREGMDEDDVAGQACDISRSVKSGIANLRETDALLVTEQGVVSRAEVVAVETRVDVHVDGSYWASFALSPCDLEDFAYGVALSTGLVDSVEDMASVETRDVEGTVVMNIVRRMPCERPNPQRCALCRAPQPCAASEAVFPGFELDAPFVPTADDGLALRPEAVFSVSRGLLSRQGMHRATGATHAAVFADAEGTVMLMREDVGRHNAVDKLIGAMARGRLDPASGFVYLSSRCALELVAKCARAGVRVVATVSAPTTAVVDFAQAEGVTLCAFAREGRFTIYAHPERFDLSFRKPQNP